MPCANETYQGVRRDNFDWENYIGTVHYTVPSYFEPSDLGDLVWILQQAEYEGRSVKAVGSGWSFEDIAQSRDWMVDIRRLNRQLDYVVGPGSRVLTEARRRQLHDFTDGSRGTVYRPVHVEAGIQIYELNRLLDRLDLAMPTLGGSQGQTLAGAISTSTHGSDLDEGPLANLVEAIHLVTTGGREVWIESTSFPVTENDDILRTVLPCEDIEIIRDDDALAAAVVGMGRFGVVYSYILRVREEYTLTEWTNELPWHEVETQLAEGVGRDNVVSNLLGHMTREHIPSWDSFRSDDLKFLDITLSSRSSGKCWIRRRWRNARGRRDIPDTETMSGGGDNIICHEGIANVLLAAAASFLRGYAGLVSTAIPLYGIAKGIEIQGRAEYLSALSFDPHIKGGQALAEIVNHVTASQVFDFMGGELTALLDELNAALVSNALSPTDGGFSETGKTGRNWQISSGNDATSGSGCYRANAVEVVFNTDTRTYLDFIELLRTAGSHYVQAGYIAIRFSRRGQPFLAMHNVSHTFAVSIEVTSLHGLRDNDSWLTFVEQRAKELGGRPHWGQQNKLRSFEVMELYSSNLNIWREQLSRIAGFSNTFSNSFTNRRGLEPINILRRVTAVRREGGRITHLCNPGQHWSPIGVDTAISQILTNLVIYYIASPTGEDNRTLIARQFITTPPDTSRANNLDSLPISRTIFGAPPDDLTDRRVTAIRQYDDPWRTVRTLVNEEEHWSVDAREAFRQIATASHSYYIASEDGIRTPIITREYLTTFADGLMENNLGSLPDC